MDAERAARDEATVIVHFYRGEISRMITWRTRLDNTTNWAIAASAAMLSVSLSSPESHHGVILRCAVLVFLLMIIDISPRGALARPLLETPAILAAPFPQDADLSPAPAPLDNAGSGPLWLRQPPIARLVEEQLRGRQGPFWQESFDRLVRSSDEYRWIRDYIEWNPVRAGLKPALLRTSSARAIRRAGAAGGRAR